MKTTRKRARDPRINAKVFTFRYYCAIFLMILFSCGTSILIYRGQNRTGQDIDDIFVILSILTYLMILAVLVMAMMVLIRRHYIMRPVRRLSDAARRVAQGDFTVRIPPYRHDGKKDEFEVLYEDFNAMAAELASTEILKSDFVSNVSHELKTPLSVIQNYAAILQEDDLTQAERQLYAQRIAAASERLTVLVTNILQLSRLENQKIVPSPRRYNLSEQLSRCAVGFEQIWEEKGIELDVDLDQSITVDTDEKLLDIVWNNLISNALKFTSRGGSVYLGAKREGGDVLVRVADTGCGISPQDINRIFEKFYQAESSRAVQGNGLGLAMVRQIMDLVGGTVTVDSTLGSGSVFTVRLHSTE